MFRYVADVMTHALLARRPWSRYLVGTDAKTIYRLIGILPEWIGDRIRCHLNDFQSYAGNRALHLVSYVDALCMTGGKCKKGRQMLDGRQQENNPELMCYGRQKKTPNFIQI
ncbi:hypothetical protein MAR_034773 [Mya arenaria]|uniref:Uncharacterized protein n=1 Tax=Mya arenaria TaxID=6604 RepID=A0ABY7EI74_MYAAR|nr:hypothetical protein MAR_034773 [Mya arenaria]